MSPYDELFERLADTPMARWLDDLPARVDAALHPSVHGDLACWQAALEALPRLRPTSIDLAADCVRAGTAQEIDAATQIQLREALMALHPWRKGPFCFYGIHVDTEWRSDWKWQRVAPHLAPLAGRRVLDVGSGNGYYGWRMLGAGAELVVGIDPTLVFVMQYQAARRLLGPAPNYVLPLGIEHLPDALTGFDTVFSMGVLYHRRDPVDHLRRLRRLLRPGGELVLETLVIEGAAGEVLIPPGRYARMRNVWAVPSVPVLMQWLEQAGLRDVRCVDLTPTTVQEQRRSDWMRFESLAECLDPQDPARTVEGHPAPVRAVLIGQA